MSVVWNLWHGCHKLSAGCAHCYVYRTDERHNRDASRVAKTGDFNLPLRKNRSGGYKIPSGELVYTCFTSDFLLADADEWRNEAWQMMKQRSDLEFMFITKRIDRLADCLPDDWGEGYPNVQIGCTTENQERADYRLPIFIKLPIRSRIIICEPLLEGINLSPYLGPWIDGVVAGGESGSEARVCDYDWVLSLRQQCVEQHVPFHFKQTGAKFKKGEKIYNINRKFQHTQARKAGIDYTPDTFKEIEIST